MKRYIHIILLLFCPVLQVIAVSPDSVYTDRNSLWRYTRNEALQNPALMTRAYLKSFTQLGAQLEYSKQSEAFCLEKGTGSFTPEVAVNSYIKLTRSSVVWGEAGYANGKFFDKVYNNVADLELLYPDIIADSIGGDTRRERYLFSGGYAAERGKWQMGGELRFRAEQEYRSYDPRMRSIVSDLNLRAGAAYALGSYRLGAFVAGNIYRQTADVDFYGETNGMGELQMTGLGTSYVRFSGSNRDIFYEGKGGVVGIDVTPNADNGWWGHLRHSMHQYERLSDEYNALPLTTLYRQQTGITVGYKQKQEKRDWALLLHAGYDKRASDEHVVGSASGQDYPILTDLTMYRQYQWDVYAAALYGRNSWHLLARAGFLSNRQSYAYEERKMQYARLYGELTAQWLKGVGKELKLDVQTTCGYAGNIRHEILMPYANMTPSITAYVKHTYNYLKASYAHVGASVRADYKPQSWAIGLFGRLGTRWQYCTEGEYEGSVNLSLGIIF